MPKVDELIELLKTIGSAGESDVRLSQLIELLRAVDRSTMRVRVEIDYDGREFFWTIPQRNLTASEWLHQDVRESRSPKIRRIDSGR